MATSTPTSIPAYNRIYLVAVWLETVLWGMNLIIFATAFWIIVRKRTGVNQWMLSVTSTILFALATMHVSASLRDLIDAFINIPADASPLYSTLYWVTGGTKTYILKDITYDLAVWMQDTVLIWRLYVVWNMNWKVCIVPLVIDLAHMAAAFGGTALVSIPHANIYSPALKGLGLAGWSLDLTVNISVTAVIAARLWYMGRRVTTLTSSRSGHAPRQNAYLVPIFTIIESGALFATVTLVMLIMYVRGSPLTLAAVNLATQLAVTTPLLIIVRVGLRLTHGLPKIYKDLTSTRTNLSTFQATSAPIGQSLSTSAIHFTTVRNVVTGDASSLAVDEFALEEFKAADVMPNDRSVNRHVGLGAEQA